MGITAALLEASARAQSDTVPLLRLLCLHPDNLATWRRLAAHYARDGAFECGLRAHRTVACLNSSDATIHIDRSTFERLVGNRTAAERAMRRALSIEPANRPGWLMLGEFSQIMDLEDKAKRLLRWAECASENVNGALSIATARLRENPREPSLRRHFRLRHGGANQPPWILDREPGREWRVPEHRVSSLLVWGEMGVGD